MNLFNRIVVVLLLLSLAAGAIAVVALAWSIPNDSINGLRDAVDWLADHNQDTEKAILTAGAIVVALIALVLIILELIPRYSTDVKVTDLRAGDAVLSTAAIAQRLEEAVRRVPHVAEVKSAVRARRKGVEVSMDLHVDPDANLAEVTDAACEAAQDVLSNRIHVAMVSPPKVRLHYRELRLRRPVAPVAAAAATPVSADNAAVPVLAGPTAEAAADEPSTEENANNGESATSEPPAADKPARPEPETENKFE